MRRSPRRSTRCVGSFGMVAADCSCGATGDGLATPQPPPPVAARRAATAKIGPDREWMTRRRSMSATRMPERGASDEGGGEETGECAIRISEIFENLAYGRMPSIRETSLGTQRRHGRSLGRLLPVAVAIALLAA